MKRFDICPLSGIAKAPYALIMQADDFDILDTRLVIPLFEIPVSNAIVRLTPVLTVKGATYIARTDLLYPAHISSLGQPIDTAAEQHLEIVKALDLLMSGF